MKPKRWWPVALVGALVAAAIVATGQGSSANSAAQVTVPPTPSTLFPPAPTTVPTARRVADAQRRAYPAVLISSDATALLVLTQDGAFEVDVAEAPDMITGFVAAPARHRRHADQWAGPCLLARVSRGDRTRQRPRCVPFAGPAPGLADRRDRRGVSGEGDARRRHGATPARDRVHRVCLTTRRSSGSRAASWCCP